MFELIFYVPKTNFFQVSEQVQGEMYGLGNTLSLLTMLQYLPTMQHVSSNPAMFGYEPMVGSGSPRTATLLADVSSTEASSSSNSDSSLCKFTDEKQCPTENGYRVFEFEV